MKHVIIQRDVGFSVISVSGNDRLRAVPGLSQTLLITCPFFSIVFTIVKFVPIDRETGTIVLPSDNSNASHTHLTRFYCRPRTIASYFSLLLKNKIKKKSKEFSS